MSKKYHIVEINDLMNHCGYGTSQTDANSGYGCNHPEQEETEFCLEEDGYTYRVGISQDEMEQLKKRGDEHIKEQGRCDPFSCPLGSQCDEQDLIDYEDGDFDGCDPFDFVLLDDETYTKLFKKGGEE